MKRIAVLLLLSLIWVLPGAAQSAGGGQDDPRALYLRGRAEQSRRNLLSAVELYRAAVQANPAYHLPLIGLAECFFTLEEYPEALSYLKEAQALDRSNLELIVLEGRIALALGEADRARRLFESVLQKEPNNLEARFGLAELDIAQGRTRAASRRYIETLQIRPESRRALLFLVRLSESQGDRSAAEAYLELALRYHNNEPGVHYEAGRYSVDVGRYDRAESYLLTAIALDEQHTEARRLLAEVYLLQNQPGRAIEILREIVAEDREIPLVWYSLGLAYQRSGDTEQAIRSLAQALRLRPDAEITRIVLENIALADLPIDDPVRERYARYHLERGALFEQRNYLDKALMEYRRALRLQPEAKEPRLRYAELHRLRGFAEKYLRELEALRNLGHDDPRILDDIEMIGSSLYESVAAQWGIDDQYRLDRKRFSVALYHMEPKTREIHPFAGRAAAEYMFDLLTRYPTLEVADTTRNVQSFESAFREARELQADYFLLMHVVESERSFTTHVEQYLASTGKRLAAYQVFRTGNDRVQDNFDILAERIHSALPLRGNLLARRFDSGVVDLGLQEGLEQGRELAIVRKGAVRLAGDRVGVTVEERDILGTFTVETVGEVVSQGRVDKKSFFDMINAGDELIAPPTEPAPEQPQDPEQPGLLRRILDLVGL